DDLVADGDAHVPERVQDRVGDGRRAGRVARAEADVEVALQGDGAATVTADAGERDRVEGLRRDGRRLGGAADLAAPLAGEEGAEEIVEDAGVAPAERDARALEGDGAGLGRDALEQLRAAPGDRSAEILEP